MTARRLPAKADPLEEALAATGAAAVIRRDMEVMAAIFGTKDFVTNSASGGGDYNVPGSVEYQNLHSDSGGLPGSQYRDTKLEYLPEGQVFGLAVGESAIKCWYSSERAHYHL